MPAAIFVGFSIPWFGLVMRAWALDEPLVARQVEKVDQLRFEYIKSLFSEMGFKGAELKMRSMLFQAYHSLSYALKGTFFEENRLKHENLRHQFFIQKGDLLFFLHLSNKIRKLFLGCP